MYRGDAAKAEDLPQLFGFGSLGIARVESPLHFPSGLDLPRQLDAFVGDHRDAIDATQSQGFAGLGKVAGGVVVIRVDVLLGLLLSPTHLANPLQQFRQVTDDVLLFYFKHGRPSGAGVPSLVTHKLPALSTAVASICFQRGISIGLGITANCCLSEAFGVSLRKR